VTQPEYNQAFSELVEIMTRLRAPDGCPWDRAQTHASLRGSFLDECYEVIEALDEGDTSKLREELGDLLLHIVFQAQIATENGEFDLAEVIRGISLKLRRRHPHVFGDAKAEDAAAVELNWEQIKKAERDPETSALASVPQALPALNYSESIQGRAARLGFDWDDDNGVIEKLAEEIDEMRRAADETEWAAEFGDLLFTLVNIARRRGVNAESALRGTNRKFYRRFGYMERVTRERGLELEGMSLAEMDALWDEAKRELG
jgi:tetrapyrrole methylase family protein / MazG family protein